MHFIRISLAGFEWLRLTKLPSFSDIFWPSFTFLSLSQRTSNQNDRYRGVLGVLRLTSEQKYLLSKPDDLNLIFQIKIKKSYTLIFICNPTVGICEMGNRKIFWRFSSLWAQSIQQGINKTKSVSKRQRAARNVQCSQLTAIGG